MSSGRDIDFRPLQLVGIKIAKVDAEPGFRQVSKYSKAINGGDHIHGVTARVGRGNDDYIVRALGTRPVKSRRLAL